jgi:CelD/BcsL family acetyltransferase involved in cellulose biosynthesis
MLDNRDRLEWHETSKLTPRLVAQWRDLYRDSISPNVYLSPDFIVTALDTFCPVRAQVVCLASGDQLHALAVVEEKGPSPRFPLRSLQLFKSVHSFQCGILVRQGTPDSTLDAFILGLLSGSARCVHFRDFSLASEVAQRVIESARRQHFIWHEAHRYERAALNSGISLEKWRAMMPSKRIKEIARTRRRLQEQGDLKWRLVRSADITDRSIETFLDLEHQGWKGAEGSSLLSNPKEAQFARQCINALREHDEAFLTELLLNDEVVAATVNFSSRDAAFAFKVAWKQALAKLAPGILNEVLFVEHVAAGGAFFTSIDSGAGGDSYINALWPDRLPMFTGYLARGPRARLLTGLLTVARAAKRTANKAVAKWSTHKRNTRSEARGEAGPDGQE